MVLRPEASYCVDESSKFSTNIPSTRAKSDFKHNLIFSFTFFFAY